MVIIGVVGTRTFNDYSLLFNILNDYDITGIVSGGATGADELAERYAHENNIPLLVHHPQWKLYGKSAGPIRNKLIVNSSDIIIAFWDGMSKGTKSTIDIANRVHKEVIVVDVSNSN